MGSKNSSTSDVQQNQEILKRTIRIAVYSHSPSSLIGILSGKLIAHLKNRFSNLFEFQVMGLRYDKPRELLFDDNMSQEKYAKAVDNLFRQYSEPDKQCLIDMKTEIPRFFDTKIQPFNEFSKFPGKVIVLHEANLGFPGGNKMPVAAIKELAQYENVLAVGCFSGRDDALELFGKKLSGIDKAFALRNTSLKDGEFLNYMDTALSLYQASLNYGPVAKSSCTDSMNISNLFSFLSTDPTQPVRELFGDVAETPPRYLHWLKAMQTVSGLNSADDYTGQPIFAAHAALKDVYSKYLNESTKENLQSLVDSLNYYQAALNYSEVFYYLSSYHDLALLLRQYVAEQINEKDFDLRPQWATDIPVRAKLEFRDKQKISAHYDSRYVKYCKERCSGEPHEVEATFRDKEITRYVNCIRTGLPKIESSLYEQKLVAPATTTAQMKRSMSDQDHRRAFFSDEGGDMSPAEDGGQAVAASSGVHRVTRTQSDVGHYNVISPQSRDELQEDSDSSTDEQQAVPASSALALRGGRGMFGSGDDADVVSSRDLAASKP